MSLNVLIVNVPIRENAKPNNVPLGIYYLSSIIKDNTNSHVHILDLNSYRPILSKEEVHKKLDMFMCMDVVLISGLITTFKWQKLIIDYFKRNKKIKIICGGGLASNLEDKCLDWLNADAICVGEGDIEIIKILKDIKNNNLKKIYKSNDLINVNSIPFPDWESVHNMETYIKNPVWGNNANNSSDMGGYKMERSLSIITGRGCPYQCKFCNRDITGGRAYRARNAESVISEIKFLVNKFNLDFIGFLDDNFAIDKKRLMKICNLLREENINVKWGGHARFNDAVKEDILINLQKSGCIYLGFGGESGNQEILNAMKKGNKIEIMKKAIALCRKYSIHPNCTWIMGWPSENRNQIRDTINFILKYAPENRKIFIATAYPKTELFNEVENKIIEHFGNVKAYINELDDASKYIINYTSMSNKEFKEIISLIKLDKLEYV